MRARRRIRDLRQILFAASLAAALAAAPARAAEPETQGGPPPRPAAFRPGRFTFGGAFGFGIGDVSWVSLAPQIGYLPMDRLWVGLSARIQYTHDGRYDPSFDSWDYGTGIFGRYFVWNQVFAHAEWNWTSYEVRTSFTGSDRESISAVLVGGGYGQPVGGHSSVIMEILYDVTGNARGIYGSSWVFRAGFVTGF